MSDITPLTRKVLVIDFRPAAVPSHWNRSDDLIPQYIAAMQKASNNILLYQIIEKFVIAEYPVLLDGRQYTDMNYTGVLADDKRALRDMHGNYMLADYQQIIQKFDLLKKIGSAQMDEVWMFGGPYFGFYESRMVGKGAFWCNAPGIEAVSRRFVMMGFNYQRDLKEMVHDFGHRSESILAWQFGSQNFLQQLYSPSGLTATAIAASAPANDYEKWLLVNGTVHRKPGGEDYGQDELAWVTALKPTWFPFAVDPNRVK